MFIQIVFFLKNKALKYSLKTLKWLTYSVVILIILLYFLLRVSLVQSYLAKKVANAMSKKAGVEIQIGAVDISDLLRIELRDLKVKDKHDSLFINTDRIAINIIPSYLFDNTLYIKDVEVDTALFSLIEYKGDSVLNLMQIVNAFLDESSDDSSTIDMSFEVKNFKIRNSVFVLDMQNMEHFEGMDYAHLYTDSINVDIHDFSIQGDSFLCNIINLSAREKCGFRLDSLAGKALLSPREISIPDLLIKANNTKAYANFKLEYTQWTDWLDFINKVRFNSQIYSSVINLDDIKYFTSSMKGMENILSVSGRIRGSIESLKVSKAEVHYGKESYFIGDIGLNGLPDFEQTFLRFRVKDALFTNADISKFYLPNRKKLPTSDILSDLGKIKFKGRFTGFYYDFVGEASFKTNLGRFSTDISLQPDKNSNLIAYSGKLNANGFDLGRLLKTDYIGKLDMQGVIKGVGLSDKANAKYNIDFKSIELAKFNYQKISVEGDIVNQRITSKIHISNDEEQLSAEGFYDYRDSLSHLFLIADIKNAEVNRFFLIPEDTLGRLTTGINIDIKGNNLNNLRGSVIADSFSYVYNAYSWIADSLYATMNIDSVNNIHRVSFSSPFFIGSIEGFKDYSEIQMDYKNILSDIMLKAQGKTYKSGTIASVADNNLDSANSVRFDFNIIDIDDVNKAFFPSFAIGKNSVIKGGYNFNNDSLKVYVNTSKLQYDGWSASNLEIALNKENSRLGYKMTSSNVYSPTEISFDSLKVEGEVVNDSLTFDILWGGAMNKMNSGSINANMVWNDTNDFNIKINSSHLYINDTLWTLKPNAKIDYRYHYLSVSDFNLLSGENSLLINGIISDNLQDALIFKFNEFDVSIIDFYTKRWDTDIDGIINGKMELSTIWTQPGFESEFDIDKFVFNGALFNMLHVKALYSKYRKAMVLDISSESDDKLIKNIDLGGFYYTSRRDNQLDLEVRLNKFPLKSIQNYLTSFSSSVNGVATGILKLKGSVDKPVILGSLKTNIDDILIDYTKVHYKINDNFIFTPNYFGFVNAQVEDKSGNNMTLTAKISHNYFDDLNFYIDVKPHEAKLLNTTSVDNDLFYGSVFGTGDFKLYGDMNKLNIKMDVTSAKESSISIPISSQYDAEQSDFVSFVIADSTSILEKENNKVDDGLDLGLDMNVNVTPKTELRLVMNATAGDVITAYGKGKMHMIYNTNGYKIYGKYIINDGNYLFTLQNIINKRFIIEPGSEINWDGELESATINMKAVYHVDAKLWDLLQQLDSNEAAAYKRPSKVNCIINISGKLLDPEISFDIKLPDETVATRELVKQVISPEATGNNEELNKNFVSLLVLGRFQPPSGYDAGSNPNALSHNTYEMLAEQVGNLLNNMVDKVEIGVDWNPGDEVTTQEVAVALTYKMLNDRLIIDGKFGTGGGSREANADTRIVGDVNIEYKLTEDGRIRAKVFNRTNYYDPLTRKAPYTQGVGITFRKEFDSFKDMFASKKKIDKKQKNVTPNENKDVKQNSIVE